MSAHHATLLRQAAKSCGGDRDSKILAAWFEHEARYAEEAIGYSDTEPPMLLARILTDGEDE